MPDEVVISTSWIYLFEFDSDQKISGVFVVQMNYN